MKLDEVIVSEVPASGIKQAARSVGSRVLNKLPGQTAKSKAANLAGKADLGATANKLHGEFSGFLGTRDKKLNQASGSDMIDFLKTKKVDVAPYASIARDDFLDKNEIDNVLMRVAKDAMSGKGDANAPAPQEPASQAGKTQNTPQDKTQGAQSSPQSAATAVPKDLQSEIMKLTPEQRSELARLI